MPRQSRAGILPPFFASMLTIWSVLSIVIFIAITPTGYSSDAGLMIRREHNPRVCEGEIRGATAVGMSCGCLGDGGANRIAGSGVGFIQAIVSARSVAAIFL